MFDIFKARGTQKKSWGWNSWKVCSIYIFPNSNPSLPAARPPPAVNPISRGTGVQCGVMPMLKFGHVGIFTKAHKVERGQTWFRQPICSASIILVRSGSAVSSSIIAITCSIMQTSCSIMHTLGSVRALQTYGPISSRGCLLEIGMGYLQWGQCLYSIVSQ